MVETFIVLPFLAICSFAIWHCSQKKACKRRLESLSEVASRIGLDKNTLCYRKAWDRSFDARYSIYKRERHIITSSSYNYDFFLILDLYTSAGYVDISLSDMKNMIEIAKLTGILNEEYYNFAVQELQEFEQRYFKWHNKPLT